MQKIQRINRKVYVIGVGMTRFERPGCVFNLLDIILFLNHFDLFFTLHL